MKIALAALLGSILPGIIGFYVLIRERNLKKYGIKTTATVVDKTLKGRSVVEYQTAQGLQRGINQFSPGVFQRFVISCLTRMRIFFDY